MPSLYTEIEINAPKSIVWRALVHKQDWLKWNTFLFDRDPTQPFKQGQTVSLSLRRTTGELDTEFQSLVTLVQPEVCLQWVTKAPGLKSEHVFELQEVGWDRTKYTHRQNLSGLLTSLFFSLMRQDEQQGLRRMARELKQYIES
jgi:hypothetical protein